MALWSGFNKYLHRHVIHLCGPFFGVWNRSEIIPRGQCQDPTTHGQEVQSLEGYTRIFTQPRRGIVVGVIPWSQPPLIAVQEGILTCMLWGNIFSAKVESKQFTSPKKIGFWKYSLTACTYRATVYMLCLYISININCKYK